MKIQLLVMVLFFTNYARADIYFCSPLHYTEASNLTGAMTLEPERFLTPDLYKYLVDTSKGFKDGMPESTYDGSCLVSYFQVICESTDGGNRNFYRLVITLPSLEFSKLSQGHKRGSVSAIVGNCTRA